MRRDEPTLRTLVLTVLLALSGVLALALPEVTAAQTITPGGDEEQSDASSEEAETTRTPDEAPTTRANPDDPPGQAARAPVAPPSPDGENPASGSEQRNNGPTPSDAPSDESNEDRDGREPALSDGEARHPDAVILRRNQESSVSVSAALGIATVGSGIVFATALGFFLDRLGAIDRCNALEQVEEVRRGCVNLASIQTQSELALGTLLGASGVLAAVGVAWLLTVVLDGDTDESATMEMNGAEHAAASAEAVGLPSY